MEAETGSQTDPPPDISPSRLVVSLAPCIEDIDARNKKKRERVRILRSMPTLLDSLTTRMSRVTHPLPPLPHDPRLKVLERRGRKNFYIGSFLDADYQVIDGDEIPPEYAGVARPIWCDVIPRDIYLSDAESVLWELSFRFDMEQRNLVKKIYPAVDDGPRHAWSGLGTVNGQLLILHLGRADLPDQYPEYFVRAQDPGWGLVKLASRNPYTDSILNKMWLPRHQRMLPMWIQCNPYI